jgi:hypothetical protein
MRRDKEAMAQLKEQQRLVGNTQIDVFERFEDTLTHKDNKKNVSEFGRVIMGEFGKIDRSLVDNPNKPSMVIRKEQIKKASIKYLLSSKKDASLSEKMLDEERILNGNNQELDDVEDSAKIVRFAKNIESNFPALPKIRKNYHSRSVPKNTKFRDRSQAASIPRKP